MREGGERIAVIRPENGYGEKGHKKAGIPAYAISPGKWGYDAIETLNQWIKSLAEIFPAQSDRVENVKSYSENAYNLVQGRVKDIPENEKERLFFLFQFFTREQFIILSVFTLRQKVHSNTHRSTTSSVIMT